MNRGRAASVQDALVKHESGLLVLAQPEQLDRVDGVERIYPAKIFEIMRLGRPCLALTPEGALSRLVRRHRLGEVVDPRDSEAIASALARSLRAFRDGTTPPHAPIGCCTWKKGNWSNRQRGWRLERDDG